MRGNATIGLHMPKDSHNIGGILRVAGCYGVGTVFYTGHRYKPSCTDTIRYPRHNTLVNVDTLRDVIPHGASPVAVEYLPERAVSLMTYTHPENAFYIFGPEDSSLGNSILSWCRDIVYIPTAYCLNLSVCVATVLYDRDLKRGAGRGIVRAGA